MKRKCTRIICLLLVLTMSVSLLTGCRASSALTRLLNVTNALNLGQEQYLSNTEEEEDVPDKNDPVEEHSEDAKIDVEEIEVGQLMEELFGGEEEAYEALQAIYSDVAETDWGVQYITENVDWDMIVAPTDEEDTESRPVTSSTIVAGTTAQVIVTETASDAPEAGVSSGVSEGETETEDSEISGGELEDEAEDEGGTGPDAEGSNEGTIPVPEEGEGGDATGGADDEEESKEVVDEEGEYEELEDRPAHSVAATGQMAIAVSMLGGGDMLCATSADYKENEWISSGKIFPDDRSVALWSGDGSTPLSEEKFQQLLDMEPDWCIEISGNNTFSESQVQRIEAAGIGYAALPGFTSAADIEETMRLLGEEVLQGDAADKAEEYLQWCADAEASLSKISGTQEIVFIEGWDSDAEIYWDLGNGEVIRPGAGCAYIRIGNGCLDYHTVNGSISPYTYYFRPLTDYLGYANVIDFSDEPGAIDPWYRSDVAYWNGYNSSGSLGYITPVGSRLSSSCTATFLSSRSDIGYTYGYWRGSQINITYSSVVGLGSGSFQTVVAKDQDTYDHLKDHWSWKYFEGGRNTSSMKYVEWIIEYPSEGVTSTIMGNYNLLVNPGGGAGDWVDGSPESILEGIWAAWAIQYEVGGDQTNGFSYSRLKNYLRDFYSEFYGYRLQDSDIDAILAGK